MYWLTPLIDLLYFGLQHGAALYLTSNIPLL